MTGTMGNAARWRAATGAVALALAIGGPALAQPADTLRVGNWDFPPGRGNPYSTVPTGVPQVYIWPAMFDTLTGIDAKGAPIAGLATEWKNIDPTTWRLTLRPNVKFQNGETLTAKTVTDLIAWFKSDAGKASVGAQGMAPVASATAVDAMTVEFKTTTPRPIFPSMVAGLYIVPEKAWAELGPEKFVTNPIGSGSYRVTSWSNEAVRAEAFKEAWRPAKVPKLEILRLQEQAARLQALLSGQIDVMIQVNADEVKAIEQAGGKIDKSLGTAPIQLGFVLENPKPGVDNSMLKDKRVRHALNYAVNKEAINQNLLGGAFPINTQWTVPNAFGWDPELKPWPYDPAMAKKLLAEAGYPNGFTLTGEVRDFFDIWAQVTQDLAQVGVKMEFQRVVQADWLRKFLGQANQPSLWDGQTFGVALGFGPEMDASRIAFFQSCRKNPAHYCNRDLMPLLDAIDAEFNVDKRKTMLNELMAKMREDAPGIMLFDQVDFVGLAKRVNGFKAVNRVFNYHDVTVN